MRNPDYQFFSLDDEPIRANLIALYEKTMDTTVTPASPQRLFIEWVTTFVLAERAEANHQINKNLASRAEGEDLDELGEVIYGVVRPRAERAVCTVRFSISEPQAASVVVPMGTRVTDQGGALLWALLEDLYIQPGDSYADGKVECQTLGKVGNGYAKGQINTLVDLYDYCDKAENITVSEGGADDMDDDAYYELMKAGQDGKGSGGARGSYIYNAKRVSALIGDVVANTTGPATVAIYVLMKDGTAAGEELKAAVLEACSHDERCPMTDLVTAKDPEFVAYNIELTYYIKKDAGVGAAQIHEEVRAAAAEYAAWQSGKLGRDINPEELMDRVRKTGHIKRVDLKFPAYKALRNGLEPPPDPDEPLVRQAPQVARLGTVTLTNGGVEDE